MNVKTFYASTPKEIDEKMNEFIDEQECEYGCTIKDIKICSNSDGEGDETIWMTVMYED